MSFLMLSIILLSSLVLAKPVFQYEWSAPECPGAPDAMYLFEMSHTDAVSPQDYNETWPPNFAYWNSLSGFNPCLSQSDLQRYECCLTSIEVTQPSLGSSVFDYARGDLNYLSLLNGKSFCHLEPNAVGGALGYYELWILQDKCVQGIACSNSEIAVYESSNCTGKLLSRYSFSAIIGGNDTSLPNTTVSRVTFDHASSRMRYITYIPSIYEVPPPSSAPGVFLIVLALIASLGLGYVSLSCFIAWFDKRRVFDLVYAVMALLFIANLWFQFAYIMLVFNDWVSYVVTLSLKRLVFNISTLAFTATIVHLVIEKLRLQLYAQITVYFLLLAVHMALAGGYYFTYFMYIDPTTPTNDSYELWVTYTAFWTVIVCLIDWTPQLALLYHRIWLSGKLKSKTLAQKAKYLFSKELHSMVYICFSVLNLLIYGAIQYVLTYHTVWVWTDYWRLSFSIVMYFTLAIQVMLRYVATITMAKYYNSKSAIFLKKMPKSQSIVMSTRIPDTQMADTQMSATRPDTVGFAIASG